MDLIFSRDRLDRLAAANQRMYVSNDPFPHIVIDDFLPTEVAERILTAFPAPGTGLWYQFDDEHEIKLQISDETLLDPYVRDVLYQLNSSMFIEFLEHLTDIDGLVSDPHFEGGGLHQIQPGGFLNVHADFNFHPRLRLDRRLNLLIYFNKDWKDEYNGHLELWDREMNGCVKRIAPVFNRCVIFSTTDFSYHGHPDVLSCPQGMTRKSMALYYYSNGRPAEEKSGEHSTIFRVRPGEDLKGKSSRSRRLKRTVKKFVPPIVIEMLSAARRRE